METKTIMQKLYENWQTLLAALLFDIVACVPGLSIIFNAMFAAFLVFQFGFNNFTATGIVMGGGAIADSVLGVLPVNIAAAVTRIITS